MRIRIVKRVSVVLYGDLRHLLDRRAEFVHVSPRHVPAKIIRVPDIPYTISMKKVELAVKNIIHGEPVLNRDALANPEALEYYRDLEELMR